MRLCLSEAIRKVTAELQGDVVPKFLPSPGAKPPRRQSPGKNVTQRADYQQVYQRERYRKELGKGYQKMPDKMKKLRREQKKRLKKKFKLKGWK